jgi:hypothetical protein
MFSLTSMTSKSATWDETHYLGLGVYLIENLRWDIPSVSLHPPLAYYLNGIPLLFLDLERNCFTGGRTGDVLAGVRRGQCLLRQSEPSGDRLLFWARLPSVFLALLLGAFVYHWGFKLYGTKGAFLSLVLFCFSPSLLAHSQLITADIALTTFGFITAYFLWENAKRPSLMKTVCCGLFAGLTLLSKYAGLIWVPIMFFTAVVAALFDPLRPLRREGFTLNMAPLGNLLITLTIAVLIVFVGYGFKISNYSDGIQIQRALVGDGLPAFLGGHVSQRGGWWYYYIYALLIKVPIPVLVFLLLVLVAWRRISTLDWFSTLCLLVPPLTFLAVFAWFSEVNVGLRYVLPIFPFVMLICGRLAVCWNRGKSIKSLCIGLLVGWYVYEALAVYPHYLAYFNQFVGGPQKGYRHLVDSNLDWGQDLKGLKSYMDQNGIKTVKLSYFGTADPSQYEIAYDPLPSFVILEPPTPCRELRKGDIVAISATHLHPLYVDLGVLGHYLRDHRPKDHIGHSIYIYELERSFRIEPLT